MSGSSNGNDRGENREGDEARERAARALSAGQRFDLVVSSIKDYAIFLLDPTGHVATWNDGAERAASRRIPSRPRRQLQKTSRWGDQDARPC